MITTNLWGIIKALFILRKKKAYYVLIRKTASGKFEIEEWASRQNFDRKV